MFKTIVSILILSSALAALGQNQLDEQGRKTGHWKVDQANGRTLYEADFFEGKPVGEMIRHYESGAVRARMVFDSDGIRNYTRMYYTTGKLAAEGWYTKQVKDSVWTYYSTFDGTVRIREPYLNGRLEGMVQSYYPSGQVSEKLQWLNSQKEGDWKQYYTTGALRLEGQYKEDQLNGSYEVYYANGNLKIKGEYLNSKSHGTWTYYDENGEYVISLEYMNGIPVDQQKHDQWIQDTLEKYQEPINSESYPEF